MEPSVPPSLPELPLGAGDGPSRLSPDEMEVLETVGDDLRSAFEVLAPYRHRAKIAVFGSARLRADSVAYNQARDLAVMLAASGFVTVTGGGPGIMTAGLEGAGPGNAVGIAIQLPFESAMSGVGVPVVVQKRFATRKLALMRRMRGFVCAAGGFGTLDEMFEVLTLVQTEHKDPTPIVLLDDGSGVFDGVLESVRVMCREELVGPDDARLLVKVTSPQAAFDHICQFFRRYRGIDSTEDGHRLRLTSPVSQRECAELGDLGFACEPDPQGVRVTRHLAAGELRVLIDELNLRSTEPLPPGLGFQLSVLP